jgi:hypothetical protein
VPGPDGHTICAINLGGVSPRIGDCARTYCRSIRIGWRDNGHERLPRLTGPIATVDDLIFRSELAEVGLADWDRDVSLAVLLEPGPCDPRTDGQYGGSAANRGRVLLATDQRAIDKRAGASWRRYSGSYGCCTYGRSTDYGAPRCSTRDAGDTHWSRWSTDASLRALN